VANAMASPDFGLFAFGPQPEGQGDTVSFDYFLLNGEPPGGGGGGGEFSDGFDGSSLDTNRWDAIVRGNSNAYEVADGELTITTEPGDIYTGDTVPPPNNFIFQDASHADDDWTIETKLSGTINGGYGQGGLMAYQDGDNYVKLDPISDAGMTRINRIELRSEVGGAIQNPQPQVDVPVGTTDYWLRLTKSGTNYTGEYSFDGETWIALPTVANAMASPDFGLFAFGPQPEGQGDTVSFDYFLLNGEPPGGGGGGGFGDEFDGATLDQGKWNSIVRHDPQLYRLEAGVLRVETAPGDIWQGGDPTDTRNFFLQTPDHAGEDWVIETQVYAGNLSGGYAHAGLMAYEDDTTYVKYDVISDQGQTEANRIELRSEVDDMTQNPQPQLTPLPAGTENVWLRLTKEGTNYSAEYSFDGEIWESLGDPVPNPMVAPRFGIFTQGASNPGDEVGFEYFELDGNRGGCPEPPPENRPPAVDAPTANPTIGFGPLEVDFSVAATDADGDELTYEWDFGDGETSNQQNPTHTYTEPGEYEAEVTVSDGEAEISRTVDVQVLEEDEPAADFRTLVFSKTAGFRHSSIDEGHTAFEQLGDQENFQVDHTEDATAFRADVLSHYDTVMFLSTTGDVFNAQQQAAFEDYIQGGGGYVGIHSASDTEYDWNWYGHLVGAYFRNHPGGADQFQEASIGVEDQEHPSTEPLPDTYQRTDEWYNFKSPDFADGGGETIVEEFDGSDVASPPWEVVRRNQNLTVSGGALHIPAEPGDLYGAAPDNAQNLVLRDAPDGPWEATASMNFEGTAQYHQAGLLVYGNDDNFTKLGRIAHTAAGDEKFEFIYETGDTPRNEAADSTANIPANFPDDFQVRITSDGTNITGAYSTDGTTWTPVGRPAPLPANARIGLFAFSNNAATSPEAAFERFELTTGEAGNADYSPRGEVHVLANIDESTYNEDDGNTTDDDHPMTWCHRYDGGRSWYTGMGHTEASYTEPNFLTQVLGGLETTAGVEPSETCGEVEEDTSPPVTTIKLNGADPVDNYDGPVEVDLDALDEEGGSGVALTEVRVDGGDWQPYVEEEVIFDGTQATFDDWVQAPGGSFELNETEGFMRTIGGLGMLWYEPKEYGDMRLSLEFRDSRGGAATDRSNAGVFIRFPNPDEAVSLPPAERYDCQVDPPTLPDGGTDPAWSAIYCGQEIQIYDGETGDPQKTGSIYNFDPLGLADANPVGKGVWSEYEITVDGGGNYSATVARDGEVINEFQNTPGQQPARAGDPPTDDRQFATGYIGLQNHGGQDVIDFRNVRVLPLTEGAIEGPFTITEDGEHTIEFRSTDNAGNVEETQSVTFTIGEEGRQAELRLTVRPRTARVSVGDRTNFTATVRNIGDAPADEVGVCLDAPRNRVAIISPKCVTYDRLRDGVERRPRFTVRARRAAAGRQVTLRFTATSPDADTEVATATLRVRNR
jgi:regulation of enolase protein 1 (concanavalin A-like superfamily)